MTNNPTTRRAAAAGGVSPIFLLIVAIFVGAGVELGIGRGGLIGTFVFVFIGWLVSLCLHEWAHAATAFAGGDRSVAERGYLTLNPLKYANPLLSIGIPLLILAAGGIGFPGGAVYLNKDALKNKWWRAIVSAAGPAMNLGLLFVCGLVIRFAPINEGLAGAIGFLALMQGTAFLLNMLPVPGLDGFGVLESFFPPHERAMIAPIANIASLIFFVLLIMVPVLFTPIFNVAQMICNAAGIGDIDMQTGITAFRFWDQGP